MSEIGVNIDQWFKLTHAVRRIGKIIKIDKRPTPGKRKPMVVRLRGLFIETSPYCKGEQTIRKFPPLI